MKNFKKRKLDEAQSRFERGLEGGARSGDPTTGIEPLAREQVKELLAQRGISSKGDPRPRRLARVSLAAAHGSPKAKKTLKALKAQRKSDAARDARMKKPKPVKPKPVKDWTEYHRLGYVLGEALRVKDEEPKSSNAYVRALNTIKEDSRIGGRYGSGPGSRPVGGWTPPTPLPKKKPEETTATTPKPTKKKKKGSR